MEFAHSLSPLSLLLVEDEDAARNILLRVLVAEFPRFKFHAAENGRRGLELFKQHAPDLIVTDVNMPQMDGIEMVREIRRLGADAPFIVLTGRSDANSTEALKEIGFCDFLFKPFIFTDLFNAIKKCMPVRAKQGMLSDAQAMRHL